LFSDALFYFSQFINLSIAIHSLLSICFFSTILPIKSFKPYNFNYFSYLDIPCPLSYPVFTFLPFHTYSVYPAISLLLSFISIILHIPPALLFSFFLFSHNIPYLTIPNLCSILFLVSFLPDILLLYILIYSMYTLLHPVTFYLYLPV